MNPVMPGDFEGSIQSLLSRDAEDGTPAPLLPASVDAHGTVMTEWELAPLELERLLRGGRVRLWVATQNGPVPAFQLEVIDVTETLQES